MGLREKTTKKRGKRGLASGGRMSMEVKLTDAVHYSLDNYLYSNAAFLAEVRIELISCWIDLYRSACTRRVPTTTRSTS